MPVGRRPLEVADDGLRAVLGQDPHAGVGVHERELHRPALLGRVASFGRVGSRGGFRRQRERDPVARQVRRPPRAVHVIGDTRIDLAPVLDEVEGQVLELRGARAEGRRRGHRRRGLRRHRLRRRSHRRRSHRRSHRHRGLGRREVSRLVGRCRTDERDRRCTLRSRSCGALRRGPQGETQARGNGHRLARASSPGLRRRHRAGSCSGLAGGERQGAGHG